MWDKPQKLEARGSDLWDKVTDVAEFDAAGYALLEDICRTADIIARLTKKLNAPHHEWVELVEDAGYSGEGIKLLVVVDHVLMEIRQQRIAMRTMLAHLKIGAVKGGASDVSASEAFWTAMEDDFANK
jgi:hypothetical protein